MLETFSASPDSMKVPEDAESAKKEARQAAKCIKKGLDEGHEEETLFAVVLWNDEQHSFNEVIAHVEDAIKCTELDAKKIAEKVDSYVCRTIETQAVIISISITNTSNI